MQSVKKLNCVVRERQETNGTCLNIKCLWEKGRTDPSQKSQKSEFYFSEGAQRSCHNYHFPNYNQAISEWYQWKENPL